MKILLDDAEMDAQLQRTLTGVHSASADLGETLATAARITPGDYGIVCAWIPVEARNCSTGDSTREVFRSRIGSSPTARRPHTSCPWNVACTSVVERWGVCID